MSMSVNDLAEAINQAIDAKDKDGNPQDVTPEQTAYATAIINTLSAGSFGHVSGITGTVPPPTLQPLTNGAASGGTFLPPLVSATWLAETLSGFDPGAAAGLTVEATASTTYLTASSLIDFAPGNITGTCGNTPGAPPAPGPLTAAQGTGGEISGLSGGDWAQLVAPPDGDPALGEAIYQAIIDYITDNADFAYPVGVIVDLTNVSCPGPGGPLIPIPVPTGGTIS